MKDGDRSLPTHATLGAVFGGNLLNRFEGSTVASTVLTTAATGREGSAIYAAAIAVPIL